jgi:hypothetical protein
MGKPTLEVSVFISSPGDVREERRRATEVVDRLNRLRHIAERMFLKPCAYEELVPPLMGRDPQPIVDEYMTKAADADLFICMLWGRMGTPVICPETKERFASGTEYEFTIAYRHNQQHGKPHMLLYRCDRPLPEQADPDQVRLVKQFWERVGGAGAPIRGLYRNYTDPAQFADLLFHDLETVLAREYKDAAPVAAATAPAPPPGARIPQFDTPFIGRTEERARIHRMLTEQGRKLITLRGTGGIGKTRLACEMVPHLAAHFNGRCFYVELKERLSADRVAYAVAYALGRAAQLNEDRDVVELVGNLLAQLPPTLLVLNNLEPVAGLAAATVGRWKPLAPDVHLLVTSRASLGVEGEQLLVLRGLGCPAPHDRTPGW